MNFDSFLPADLKNVLEKEMEIMKQAATTGSMDVCLRTTDEDRQAAGGTAAFRLWYSFPLSLSLSPSLPPSLPPSPSRSLLRMKDMALTRAA